MRDWPSDGDVVPQLPASTREPDGREKLALVTVPTYMPSISARSESTLVVRTHPGTGEITLAVHSKECR